MHVLCIYDYKYMITDIYPLLNFRKYHRTNFEEKKDNIETKEI